MQKGNEYKTKGNIQPLWKDIAFCDCIGRGGACSSHFYPARSPICLSIFSMNIPYPVVGSLTSTCVTILRFAPWQVCFANLAPTSLPFWMIGLPLSSVVNKGQQLLTDTLQYDRNRIMGALAFASNQEINISANMLPLKISTVYIIVHYLELRIEFGCSVGGLCNRNRGFTSFFGEKAYGSVFQPRYFDRSSVSRVGRGRFAAGDHTAILFNEYSAFPMLTSAETI